ncbi:MAG: adenosine kinase [Candidatus Kapaibacterium sp.]
MKNIDLCGLGNALVDFQFDVSELQLKEIGYEKGHMTLVDMDVHANLIEKLSDNEHHKCSGGSAANTVIAFSAFGGKSAYKTVLGNDVLGQFYAQEFRDLGIVLRAPFVDDEPTGASFVLITPDSERTMLTYLGATSHFGEEHIDEEIIKNSKWLYIEGYKFSLEKSTNAIMKALQIAKKHDTRVAVTFSDYFITESFRVGLDEVVSKSDLVFCNETEAQSFTRTGSVEEAYRALTDRVPNVIVTMSERGSMIKYGRHELLIPAYQTRPVDSTGAGDMYAAGFFYGMIHNGTAEKAGHLASYAASRVVSQYGARLDEDHKKISEKIFNEIL